MLRHYLVFYRCRYAVQCHSGYFCTVVAGMALLSSKATELRATLAASAACRSAAFTIVE